MLRSPSPRDLALACLLTTSACSGGSEPTPPPPGSRVVAVEVNARGYAPDEIAATPGEALHLVFTRTSDEGCGQQLVFPDLDLRRDLPLAEPVAVDVTAPATGRLGFTCGMDMYRGAVVVR